MLLPKNTASKSYLPAFFINHLVNYPTPISLTYAWSFGSLAGITLVIQMITGVFLSMHYTANIELAFKSIEYIMRDVPNGWLIRYIHANGASMFFIVIYGHVCRGLYYGSYINPRQLLWCSGVVLLFLMMATAFTGYVLPWGQMSLWGATVITSMVTVIPVAGKYILQWLWGGYTIKNPTLVIFYTLNFVLPFLLAGFTLTHIALLHKVNSSSSPIKSNNWLEDVSTNLLAFSVYLLVFSFFVLYYPNFLNHLVNYIPAANPMRTPAHDVVPEWCFLPYYAVLRSIPHKTGCILAILGSLLVLFLILFISTSKPKNTTDRPIFNMFFWIFILDILVFTWVEQKPERDAYILTGQVATIYYYFFFLLMILAAGFTAKSLIIALKFNKKIGPSGSQNNLTPKFENFIIVGLLCLIILESYVLDRLITSYVFFFQDVYILKEQLAHFYRAASTLHKIKESLPDHDKPNLYLLIPMGSFIGYACANAVMPALFWAAGCL